MACYSETIAALIGMVFQLNKNYYYYSLTHPSTTTHTTTVCVSFISSPSTAAEQ